MTATFWSMAGGVVGGLLGGPAGAASGAMAGALVGEWLPGPAAISKKMATDFAKERIVAGGGQAWFALSGAQQELLGHDLPRAFHDAALDAVYDIGGPLCFPKQRSATTDTDFASGQYQWQYRYDLGLLRHRAPALADKVCASLRQLAADPLAGMDGEEGRGFTAVLDTFTANNQPLLAELAALGQTYDLDYHLRRYLEERTRLHLVEHLKQRPEAWRAFNLLLLQTLQATIVTGQELAAAERADILAAVHALQVDWHGRDEERLVDELDALESRLLQDAQRRHEELRADHQALHDEHEELRKAIADIQRPPGRSYVLHRPERAEKFTGRAALVDKVAAALQPGKVVSLIGMGGIGKTAVAAEAIWRLAPDNGRPARFPDGVLWYSFYGKPDIALAMAELLRQTNGEESGGPEAALRRALAGRAYLIYLDGTEEAGDLPALLALRDNNTVLISSRSRRDRHGQVFDVPFLPLEESKRLLRAWGEEGGAAEEALAAICELVGNLPLAVRLAGEYIATTRADGG